MTVGLVLCARNGLYMVRSARAEREKHNNWWTLPQEGVESADRTLLGTALRCIEEEFGVNRCAVALSQSKMLGYFDNKIPKDRPRYGGMTKRIFYLALAIEPLPIELAQEENTAYDLVRDHRLFRAHMRDLARLRPQKYECLMTMVGRACRSNFLRWDIGRFEEECDYT